MLISSSIGPNLPSRNRRPIASSYLPKAELELVQNDAILICILNAIRKCRLTNTAMSYRKLNSLVGSSLFQIFNEYPISDSFSLAHSLASKLRQLTSSQDVPLRILGDTERALTAGATGSPLCQRDVISEKPKRAGCKYSSFPYSQLVVLRKNTSFKH